MGKAYRNEQSFVFSIDNLFDLTYRALGIRYFSQLDISFGERNKTDDCRTEVAYQNHEINFFQLLNTCIISIYFAYSGLFKQAVQCVFKNFRRFI